MSVFKIAALSTALLLASASLAVQAVEVSVGGSSVSTGSAGGDAVSGTASVGGGAGNVANAHFDANGNLIDLNIGSGAGPLVTGSQNGNPANGSSATAASVNLGSLLEGIDVGGVGLPGGGSGGGGGGGMQNVVAALSVADRNLLKLRCKTVMQTPTAFQTNVVQLCRLIASM
jgi:hypothetical protein